MWNVLQSVLPGVVWLLFKDTGVSRDTHTLTRSAPHASSEGLIYVRVGDSPEASTHPSNTIKGEGDQVRLCQKSMEERKRLKSRCCSICQARYISCIFFLWEWNKQKIKVTVVNAVFWITAGGVQSIKSAPWLLKKLVNWCFSVQLRHEMMEAAQTDHKYISISLSTPTLLYLPALHHSFSCTFEYISSWGGKVWQIVDKVSVFRYLILQKTSFI